MFRSLPVIRRPARHCTIFTRHEVCSSVFNLRHQLPNADAWVRFRIDDIHLPTPHEVLAVLHRDEQIIGQIVTCTDEGDAAFAVVRVNGYPKCVIVPIACLESLDTRVPDLTGEAPSLDGASNLPRRGIH